MHRTNKQKTKKPIQYIQGLVGRTQLIKQQQKTSEKTEDETWDDNDFVENIFRNISRVNRVIIVEEIASLTGYYDV